MKIGFIFNPIILFIILLGGCGSDKNAKHPDTNQNQKQYETPKNFFKITEPGQDIYVSPGEMLEAGFEFAEESINIDSTKYFMNGELLKLTGDGIQQAQIHLPDLPPGAINLRILIYFEDGKSENHSVRIKVTSDKQPESYGYKVINSFPHDKGAFTQGLLYHDGYLYEGTGNYGASSLRKTDLETGEILKYRNLSSDLFGEGITLINGKIFQITYRAQVGFVYDENSFDLIRKIYYQIKEGWGLTNDGDHILMSDGSHIIYFMDTTYFSMIRRIEVFDHEKEVDLLNELELIDGVLYANRYTTNEIVMIDPQTGRLLGRIDMTGILDPKDRHPSIDYFNGIAYDHINDRIFVTGKYWPRVYEVKFFKKD